MKVITIGRGEDNQIVLEDNQDMISRRHATLRIYKTGKMEIVSTGSNGTFVNGFRIKPNVAHKVTRKDVISFAHVRQLDWTQIPDPFRWIRLGIIGGVIVALACIALVLLWPEKKDVPVVPVHQVIQTVPVNEKQKEKPEADTPKDDQGETVPVKEEKVVPTKKFPSVKKEDREKEEQKEQKEDKTDEENPQNLVL